MSWRAFVVRLRHLPAESALAAVLKADPVIRELDVDESSSLLRSWAGA